MSECEKCGRDDGHHIGCPESQFWANADELAFAEDLKIPTIGVCAFGDCDDPRRPKGKGRAPIYCETHSDPKNRK